MRRSLAIFIASLVAAHAQFARADGIIRVLYVERPPYTHLEEDGSVTGLVATPVAHAFKEAGIPFVWARTSVNRQFAEVQKPGEMACAIAWFKTPEREKFAKFTKAVYRDLPFVLVARSQFLMPSNATVESILATKGVRVLAKRKYSYGPTIDSLFVQYRPAIVYVDSEYLQLPLLLQANRADFMFEPKEAAEYLLANRDPAHDLRMLTPAHSPPGEKRYIACNKAVSDETINRLNRIIHFE
jgi:polar amino acid transport system substrate-binding protein